MNVFKTLIATGVGATSAIAPVPARSEARSRSMLYTSGRQKELEVYD